MTDLSTMSDDDLQTLYHATQAGFSDSARQALYHEAAPASNPLAAMSDDELKAAYGKTTPQGPMSWSDVGSQALQNAPGSAVQFGANIVQPFLHPIQTAENIGEVGGGLLQKAGLMSGHEHEAAANAVGQFFAQRYGGMENFKRSLAQDPVGVAGDLSMLLTGGGGALARAPGLIGKVGEVAGTVGRTIDPLRAIANPLTGEIAARSAGVTTGVGADAIRTAAQAGTEGGQAGEAFRQSMRGNVPMADVVDEARGAIAQMRRERGAAYRSGMADVGQDSTVLDFGDINQAIDKAQAVQTYKGQSLNPKTADIRGEMRHAVNEWETFPPDEFHTVLGIDALKRKLGNIRDGTQPNTPERVAADTIYNAVRQTIVDQAPAYAKVMKAYEDASTQVKNIERELSLNPNANIDTGLRKLQSVLRDNVNTSFGRRKELANYLVNAGAPNLLEKLAGQSLHSFEPRGLSRMVASMDVPAAIGTALMGHPAAALGIAGSALTTSPRLIGEATHAAARAARRLRPLGVAAGARQIGQVPYTGPNQ